MFTTKHSFATTINNKQGDMKYSFVESLAGKGGGDIIYKTLMEMGSATIDKYDVNNDNKITEADFLDPKNGQALINALTNIKDKENFDFQTAKKVAAEFYADGLAQVEFEDGVKLRKVDKGDGKGLTAYQIQINKDKKTAYDAASAEWDSIGASKDDDLKFIHGFTMTGYGNTSVKLQKEDGKWLWNTYKNGKQLDQTFPWEKGRSKQNVLNFLSGTKAKPE